MNICIETIWTKQSGHFILLCIYTEKQNTYLIIQIKSFCNPTVKKELKRMLSMYRDIYN